MSKLFEFICVYECVNSFYFYNLDPYVQYILETSLGAVISEKNTIGSKYDYGGSVIANLIASFVVIILSAYLRII
jgi:hypothetical protein